MTDLVSTTERGGFLLGVGAQKAGTSWLHQQLQQRRDCNFGFLKEYHIHDAMTVPNLAMYRKQKGSLLKPRTWRRQRFFADPQRYYNYFASLLRRDQILLSGDITPSYCSLSSSTLKTIQREFNKREIAVRPVFLMRDPVERILSSMRMKLRKTGMLNPEAEISTLKELIRRRPERISMRSDYVQTLASLHEAFGLNNCFIGFYETLFREDTYTQLCDFLGLNYQEPQWTQKVNQSLSTSAIPNELMREIGSWQASTLTGVQRYLPDTNLSSLWPTAFRCCVNSPISVTPG
ncbi:MAG: sulfotransferase domain-containing protein [Prochlorococcus sp.]